MPKLQVKKIITKSFSLLPVLTIALLLVTLIGCDKFYGASGTVYEWMNPPLTTQGEIYVDTLPPFSVSNFQPISGAEVSFYKIDSTHLILGPNSTNIYGNFGIPISGNTLGLNSLNISVQKEGFYPITKEFPLPSNAASQNFVILLVRIS